MALISTQHIVVGGTAPTYASAATGDTAAVGDTIFLVVKNSAASATVTIAVPGTLANNVAAPDTTVTVAATTGEVWIPLDSYYADPTDQKAHLTYSTTAGLTRAVIKR